MMIGRAPVLALAAWGLLLVGTSAGAQDPVRQEQVVFSLLAYDGRQYVPTFAREPVDEIYLLADTAAVFAPRLAFVYYWPLSQSWRVETSALNIPLGETLEVVDAAGLTRTIQRTPYTYYNAPGRYDANWVIATGDAAHAAYNRYLDLFAAYQRETVAFNQRRGVYETTIAELASRIAATRADGGDPTAMEAQRDSLPVPAAPRRIWEEFYSVPPVNIVEGFVLDLPAGRYQMRLRTADGLILQGSEKQLVAFAKLRSDGVGYEVMPGDRWTRPSMSVTPGAILYVDGSTDLFVRPHLQDQYNDLAYAKLVNADAVGNARLTRWEKTSQIPDAVLLAMDDAADRREPTRLREEPFLVEQVEGNRMGYRIVPYLAGAGGTQPPRPDIIAFRIDLRPGNKWVRLALQDPDARAFAGAERQIRVVEDKGRPLLLGFAALPLLALAVVLIRRARSYQ